LRGWKTPPQCPINDVSPKKKAESSSISLMQLRRLSMQFMAWTSHASRSISHASCIVDNQLLPHNNNRPSAPRLRVEGSGKFYVQPRGRDRERVKSEKNFYECVRIA